MTLVAFFEDKTFIVIKSGSFFLTSVDMSSVYLSFFNNLSTKVSLLPVLYFLFFIKEVCTKPIN